MFYWIAALEMVVKGFNDIVGVHWFQDDSGVLYSHQNMFLDYVAFLAGDWISRVWQKWWK